MKKLFNSIVVCCLVFFTCFTAFSVSGAERRNHSECHYDCRMPARDKHSRPNYHNRPGQPHHPGPQYISRYYNLIGDFPLSSHQLSRIEKHIDSFLNAINQANMRYGINSRRPDPMRYNREYEKAFDKLMRNQMKTLNRQQIHIFGQRVRDVYPPLTFAQSAPRPGSGSMGPIEQGPRPIPMTR